MTDIIHDLDSYEDFLGRMSFASVPCPETGQPCSAISCVNDMTCDIRRAEYPDEVIDAAARVLDAEGRAQGWWSKSVPPYDALGPIEKSEFGGLVERMLRAAKKAREA